MLEYTLSKVVCLVLIYRIYSLDYPCQKSYCGTEYTCYPVAVNCQNENCSYQNRCLKSRLSPSPCPRGEILMRDNDTPYTCDYNNGCPSETFCHRSNTGRTNICCWKPTQPNSEVNLACPVKHYGNCNKACSEDVDCGQNQRCCYNGCGQSCVTITTTIPDNMINRPGSCPIQKPAVFVCSLREKCYTDADCKGGYICCHISGCGSICRPPITRDIQRIDTTTHRRTFNIALQFSNARQISFPNTVQQAQQRNSFNDDSQISRGNLLSERPPQTNSNQFNTASVYYNSNGENPTVPFKKCPWFRVLYGGC